MRFRLPPSLWPPKHCFFSSVLRVAHPSTELWTHYDVPDNFLIQLQCSKRVVLFSPSQVHNLYVNESSSTVMGLASGTYDRLKYPLADYASRYAVKAHLQPGDILYIPSCWLHAVQMLASQENEEANKVPPVCLSVNVFFNSAKYTNLYDPKDIYGNKDLILAQRATQQLRKHVIPVLRELPQRFASFYMKKLAAELMLAAENTETA